MRDYIKSIVEIINKASAEKNTDYFFFFFDIFQARLDSYISHTGQYLLSAVIGEIGSNTFDHNWEYQKNQTRGVYFSYDDTNQIVLADFGRGVRESLAAVKKCESDLEAIKVAFTEQISGRAPEQRGNGLKFVLESVKEKKWSLYFQSGGACCIIENGNVEFLEEDGIFPGCIAVLKAGAD